MEKNKKENIIIENAKGEKEIIPTSKIRYLEADRRRLKVIIGDGKNHYIKEKISDFEKKLEQYYGFIRVGRSYIINIFHVDHWERRGLVIEGKYISISASRYKDFEKEIERIMNL